ncbi:MAG: hypothetical protein LBI19_03350 [Oscillospiraceae bacterium]|jgi:hypothetical protein|nr:hypothetical protein [Oscillospiraceae bacterium]
MGRSGYGASNGAMIPLPAGEKGFIQGNPPKRAAHRHRADNSAVIRFNIGFILLNISNHYITFHYGMVLQILKILGPNIFKPCN